MKINSLFFFFILLSCTRNHQISVIKRIHEKGYVGLLYKFHDNGNRNISLKFVNDSVILIRNTTNISHNYYLLNFTCEYLYRKAALGTIYFEKLIKSDKVFNKNDKYIKPYNNKPFPLDNSAIEYIFPDIEGDSAFFSKDLRKLQIKEFSFDKVQ